MTDTVRVPHPLDGAFITTETTGSPDPTKRHSALKFAFSGEGCIERLHAAEDYLKSLVEADRLAASPQGEVSSAEWIKHDGGPNPVPGKMVEVRYRNGETETRTANRLGWNHWEAETPGLGGYDIIAYRVTEGVKP